MSPVIRTFVRVLFRTVLLLLGVGALVGGAVGWHLWERFHQPYAGWQGEETLVDVEPGTSAVKILGQLEDAGVLRDARLARLYLVYRLDDPHLKAGQYRFREPLAAPQVLERLIRGNVVTHAVTLIEGLDLRETAQSLAAQGFGDLDLFLEEMGNPSRIRDLDPEAPDLEGYLYPETYHFARGTPETEIVDTLVETFRRGWEEEVEPIVANDPRLQELGVRGLVTLASIVEKETQADEERALVASVYANRLRIGMPLQADPTVIMALKKLGRWDGNIRRKDLEIDHPYNTYVHGGLPPGPICSPTLASLLAATQPADSEYLYFVSKNDGTHVFSRTLREHNRAVHRWQKQYWREKWAEERRRGGEGG